MNQSPKKAVVLAGSRGIGKAVASALRDDGHDVTALSREQLDTSDLAQCEDVAKSLKSVDILVLNTGGPPAISFNDTTVDDWEKYHRQLLLGFIVMLKNIHVNDGGYIFLISSNNIKEPDSKLILSNAYRIAFTSVLKSLSHELAPRHVSCINIAPGPMDTDRLQSLVGDVEDFGKNLPMQRVGKPKEIGDFVASIVDKEIKYLSGVTINFDGALSKTIL